MEIKNLLHKEGLITERRSWEIRGILAIVYTIGYFGAIVLVFYVKPPDANADTIKTLFGLLSAIEVAIVQYYFGSSRDVAQATSTTNTALDKIDQGKVAPSTATVTTEQKVTAP